MSNSSADELHLGERHMESRAQLVATCLLQGLAAEGDRVAGGGGRVEQRLDRGRAVAAARQQVDREPHQLAAPDCVPDLGEEPAGADGATRTADGVGRVGQSERELGELGGRRMSASCVSAAGGGVELGGDRLVRAASRSCEMPRPLLGLGHEVDEPRVDLADSRRARRVHDRRRKQRMREASCTG